VIYVLDEMVRVQTQVNPNGKEVELWIETESNKIAWPGTQTRNEKQGNYIYFLEFFKNIEPAESEEKGRI
jgi:hypothetical protein